MRAERLGKGEKKGFVVVLCVFVCVCKQTRCIIIICTRNPMCFDLKKKKLKIKKIK